MLSFFYLFSTFLHWNLYFVFLRATLPAGHASGCVCRGPHSWLFASCRASSLPGPTACWRSSLTAYGLLSCGLPHCLYFLTFCTGTYTLFSCTLHFLLATPQVVCVEGPAPGYLLVAGPVLYQGPRPVDGVHSLCMDCLAVVSFAAFIFLLSVLEPALHFPARHASCWPCLRSCV